MELRVILPYLAESTAVSGSIHFSGLRQALERFDSNGTSAKQGSWRIAKGGYDLDWELYYNEVPVIQCVDNTIQNVGLSDAMFKMVADIVKQEYSDVAIKFTKSNVLESSNTMGSVVKSGKVSVEKSFKIKWFDEDDGWCETVIKPGEYEYRVLNVNGWKPRQLKVNNEWMDVESKCEELENILSAVDETTTVSSIAPTVSYMGHITPVVPDYTTTVKVPKNKKKKKKMTPIERLLSGENVRVVVSEQLGLLEEKEQEDLDQFQKISKIKDILSYPGKLIVGVVHRFKSGKITFSIEDPEISKRYKGDKSKVPYITVEIKVAESPDKEVELQKLEKDFNAFKENSSGFRRYLADLTKDSAIRSIYVYAKSPVKEESNLDAYNDYYLNKKFADEEDALRRQQPYKDAIEEYNKNVDKFKDATSSDLKFYGYSGSLTVDSELKPSKNNSDSDDICWEFIIRDEDLDGEEEVLGLFLNGSDFDFSDELISKYFIIAYVLFDKNADFHPAIDLVSKYNKSGKDAKKLIKELLDLPGVIDIELEWDSDS